MMLGVLEADVEAGFGFKLDTEVDKHSALGKSLAGFRLLLAPALDLDFMLDVCNFRAFAASAAEFFPFANSRGTLLCPRLLE